LALAPKVKDVAEEQEKTQETAAETAPAATAQASAIPEPDPKKHYFWGTGRRKRSVCRVRLRAGTGKFLVNNREVEKYFTSDRDRNDVIAPLKATGTLGKVDVFVNASGGGMTGQAGATMLGVARALNAANPELHGVLSSGGYLTRDSRMVERKKYGRRGARRSFQFSKR
jgi:small subunit ribosomal protein S9